jgi:hypothetical protein
MERFLAICTFVGAISALWTFWDQVTSFFRRRGQVLLRHAVDGPQRADGQKLVRREEWPERRASRAPDPSFGAGIRGPPTLGWQGASASGQEADRRTTRW